MIEDRLKDGLKKWGKGDRLLSVDELPALPSNPHLLTMFLLYGMGYSHQQVVSLSCKERFLWSVVRSAPCSSSANTRRRT